MNETRTYRVEVWSRVGDALRDPRVQTAHQLGIESIVGSLSVRLFFLSGAVTPSEIETLAVELLADPVTEQYSIGGGAAIPADHTLEVTLLPGVTDPAAENQEALGMLEAMQAAGTLPAGYEDWITGFRKNLGLPTEF